MTRETRSGLINGSELLETKGLCNSKPIYETSSSLFRDGFARAKILVNCLSTAAFFAPEGASLVLLRGREVDALSSGAFESRYRRL